jgi:hypothetical protein
VTSHLKLHAKPSHVQLALKLVSMFILIVCYLVSLVISTRYLCSLSLMWTENYDFFVLDAYFF